MFFWYFLAFLVIHWMLAIWSLVPLPFLNPAWTSESPWFTYCWSLAWRILSITLLVLIDECNCAVVWAFFVIAFLWHWNENWPFPVPLLKSMRKTLQGFNFQWHPKWCHCYCSTKFLSLSLLSKHYYWFVCTQFCCCSVPKLCPTLCDPMCVCNIHQKIAFIPLLI